MTKLERIIIPVYFCKLRKRGNCSFVGTETPSGAIQIDGKKSCRFWRDINPKAIDCDKRQLTYDVPLIYTTN